MDQDALTAIRKWYEDQLELLKGSSGHSTVRRYIYQRINEININWSNVGTGLRIWNRRKSIEHWNIFVLHHTNRLNVEGDLYESIPNWLRVERIYVINANCLKIEADCYKSSTASDLYRINTKECAIVSYLFGKALLTTPTWLKHIFAASTIKTILLAEELAWLGTETIFIFFSSVLGQFNIYNCLIAC